MKPGGASIDIEENIETLQSFARTILPLLASVRLRPVVDRVLPMEDAASADAAMERNANFDKIVLKIA